MLLLSKPPYSQTLNFYSPPDVSAIWICQPLYTTRYPNFHDDFFLYSLLPQSPAARAPKRSMTTLETLSRPTDAGLELAEAPPSPLDEDEPKYYCTMPPRNRTAGRTVHIFDIKRSKHFNWRPDSHYWHYKCKPLCCGKNSRPVRKRVCPTE